MAVQPDDRLAAHGQMQVAGLLSANRLKQLIDEQRAHCRHRPPEETPMDRTPGHLIRSLRRLTLSWKPGVHRIPVPRLGVRKRALLPDLTPLFRLVMIRSSVMPHHNFVPARSNTNLRARHDAELSQDRIGRRRPMANCSPKLTRVQAFLAPISPSETISCWVIRSTSSSVVVPLMALMIPSSNNVRIPCFRPSCGYSGAIRP